MTPDPSYHLKHDDAFHRHHLALLPAHYYYLGSCEISARLDKDFLNQGKEGEDLA